MGKIADKHAECSEEFAAFEDKFGSAAAEEILDRIVGEMWSEGSSHGLIIRDIEAWNATNHTVTGCIEHQDVWYHFKLRSGDSDGTHIEEFGLDDPDVEVRPPELDVSQKLVECLEGYMRAHPYVQDAGYACMRNLRAVHAKAKTSMSPATEQTHTLLRAILGDFAYREQDYASDGLAIATKVLKTLNTSGQLFRAMSLELKEVICRACDENPALGSPLDFLTQGLEPVYRYDLVR